MSPTQRTLKKLRDEGWTAWIVEKWNAHAKIRQDLFGFIDIVAIKSGEPVLGVQATSGSNTSARVKKAIEIPALRTWLETGSKFTVWGWKKKGARSKRKTWQVNEYPIHLEDLEIG